MSDTTNGWQVAIEFGPDGCRSVALRDGERKVLEEFGSVDEAFACLTDLLPTEEPPVHRCGGHCWQVGGDAECIYLSDESSTEAPR